MCPAVEKARAALGGGSGANLVEVGPRACLNPILIFSGAFGGGCRLLHSCHVMHVMHVTHMTELTHILILSGAMEVVASPLMRVHARMHAASHGCHVNHVMHVTHMTELT